MPALAGEPHKGLTKVQLVDALGSGRYWTLSVDDVNPITANGDQATWDFEGDSVAVTLRVEWAADAGTSIGQPDTINVKVVDMGGGGVIGSTWTFTPVGDSGSATRTMHFDTDPLDQVLAASGSRRYGMLQLYLQVIDNPGGTTNDYTLDSQGVALIGPPLTTTYSWARGYIRQGAAALSLTVSNASLGGAEPSAWAYPDSIFVRGITTTPPFSGPSTGTVRVRRPQAQGGASERDKNTQAITTASPNFESSFTDTGTGSGDVDNKIGTGMFLGSESKDVDLEFGGPTFDGVQAHAWAPTQPAGFTKISDVALRYVGKMTNVDPRIKFTGYHLLQVDDSAYGTPPMSKNVATATRTNTEFGFVSERAMNSRDEAQNGLTCTTKLWDIGELSGSEAAPTVSRSAVSATKGGEVGWGGSLLAWSNASPGGTWLKKVTITAPGNAVGLEQDNTQSLTLVASDSRIRLHSAAGDPSNPGTHWIPGRTLTIGMRLMQDFTPVSADAGTGFVGIMRFDPATGRIQALQSVSPAVWVYLANGTPIPMWAATASPGDADTYLKTFTAAQTADFDSRDLFFHVQLSKTGATYGTPSAMEAVGGFAPHDESIALRIRSGNLAAPGRHVVVGDSATVGVALQDPSGIVAMDAGSAYYSAQRLNSSTNRYQVWNGSAWVDQTAAIWIPATIGANPLEPLLALATLPSSAIDRADNIFLFAKATRTRAGSVYAQPYEGEGDLEVVDTKFKHDATDESSIPFDTTSGHDHDGVNSRAVRAKFDPTGLFM